MTKHTSYFQRINHNCMDERVGKQIRKKKRGHGNNKMRLILTPNKSTEFNMFDFLR